MIGPYKYELWGVHQLALHVEVLLLRLLKERVRGFAWLEIGGGIGMTELGMAFAQSQAQRRYPCALHKRIHHFSSLLIKAWENAQLVAYEYLQFSKRVRDVPEVGCSGLVLSWYAVYWVPCSWTSLLRVKFRHPNWRHTNDLRHSKIQDDGQYWYWLALGVRVVDVQKGCHLICPSFGTQTLPSNIWGHLGVPFHAPWWFWPIVHLTRQKFISQMCFCGSSSVCITCPPLEAYCSLARQKRAQDAPAKAEQDLGWLLLKQMSKFFVGVLRRCADLFRHFSKT